MSSGRWVCLFSGGKDSSWALHRALETGLDVGRLVTVDPIAESEMYHVPMTDIVTLAAESIGIDCRRVSPTETTLVDDISEVEPGLQEMWPLITGLAELDGTFDDGVAGICIGTVEHGVAANIIEEQFDSLDIDLFAPLWRKNPHDILRQMVHAGFEMTVVEVDTEYLDPSWLGRPIDDELFATIERLQDERDLHPLGEGNEYETIVTDGPHMDRPIELSYDESWDGTLGRLEITDAQFR